MRGWRWHAPASLRPNADADSDTDTEYWRDYDVHHVNTDFVLVSLFSICGDAHAHFRIRIHVHVHGYNFVDFDSYVSPCDLYPIIGTHTHIRTRA
jgi:hypothetical protein